MKKIIFLIILTIIGAAIIYVINSQNKEVTQKEVERNPIISNEKKVAIVYFSATGTTKIVAEYIKTATGGDIFEIIPQEEYTSDDLDYNNKDSRATKEQNDSNARPAIKNEINVDNYDVIFLGYPIWWGDVPRIIQTFVESNTLDGKTVIPFCTSGSSGISKSENTLKTYSKINWLSGKRLTNSENDIKDWLNNLNYWNWR